MPLPDHLLLTYLAGAADPGDAALIAALRRTDPQLRQRLALFEARHRALFPPPTWPLPTTRIQAISAWMDTAPLRVGDCLTLRFPATDLTARPLLIREVHPDPATVIFPVDINDWPSLADFPLHDDLVELELVLADPPGLHRYRLILLPTDWDVDETLPEDLRWEPVRSALEEGTLTGALTEVHVQAAAS